MFLSYSNFSDCSLLATLNSLKTKNILCCRKVKNINMCDNIYNVSWLCVLISIMLSDFYFNKHCDGCKLSVCAM